ncbi:MAG: hypothetical protein NZ533_08925 [Casimicrobiaceae bacterium]|nr:hypothetical protein [Casimicrobiaceae bacterium]MCX8098649.1 hypothetical protein [Casimicrobiaceae bacterium]MDW8311914.1 hypothetical protein [Burkholderiales bacterium]
MSRGSSRVRRRHESAQEAAFTGMLAAAMQDASHVLVGGEVFSADYLQLPDEFTQPDDVLVEGSGVGHDLLLTRRDFDGARRVGPSDIVLADGTLVRFLRAASVH